MRFKITEIGTYSTICHYEHFSNLLAQNRAHLFSTIPDYAINLLDCHDFSELELF